VSTQETPAVPGPLPYQIVGVPIQVNEFNQATQTVEQGWQVRAQWKANGSIITVFVPSSADLASAADALIRAQGQQLDALHSL
jgi:hypothetical protein